MFKLCNKNKFSKYPSASHPTKIHPKMDLKLRPITKIVGTKMLTAKVAEYEMN